MISTQDRLAEQWIESQLAKSWAAHYEWCSRRLIPILADYLLPEFIPIIAEYWLSWIGALAGPLIPELNPYCYPVYPPRLSPQHLITDHIVDTSVDHERPTVWAIVDSRGFPYASGTKELYSHARHLRARVVHIHYSALLPPDDASTLRPARQWIVDSRQIRSPPNKWCWWMAGLRSRWNNPERFHAEVTDPLLALYKQQPFMLVLTQNGPHDIHWTAWLPPTSCVSP